MPFVELYKIDVVRYLCLIMPPIFGTCLAIYSEMPTSDSIRRMIAPLSSCKGGAVPRREWLGGRMDSFVVTLAESNGPTDKVTDESGADFDSSVLSSTFNRFDGGASVVLSKYSRPWALDEVESISHRTAMPESQCLPRSSREQSDGSLSRHLRRPRKKTDKSCREGPPRSD